jgi:hypothetical protein
MGEKVSQSPLFTLAKPQILTLLQIDTNISLFRFSIFKKIGKNDNNSWRKTHSQAAGEPIERPIEEHRPPNPMDRDDLDNTSDQQDWWDDANVSGLIDLEAFHHFLYNCDQLLKKSESDCDDGKVTSHVSGSNTKPLPDEQPKLGQSPPT